MVTHPLDFFRGISFAPVRSAAIRLAGVSNCNAPVFNNYYVLVVFDKNFRVCK